MHSDPPNELLIGENTESALRYASVELLKYNGAFEPSCCGSNHINTGVEIFQYSVSWYT